MTYNMKRFISALLTVVLIFALFCGCKDKSSEQGEGLSITFNNEEGAVPQQTEPAQPLNKAMEREELTFKGDHYGVVVNNMKEYDVTATDVEIFYQGNGSSTIVVMPYYEGSRVLVESVVYDMATNGIIPTDTLFEATSTDDFALVAKVDRPQGVMPEMRITVEYEGQVYSHLIKNTPDAQIEYIR